jgi:hypothetical protein
MQAKNFKLEARVSTDSPALVKPILEKLITRGTVKPGGAPDEFLVVAEMTGASARDLNRSLLSVLRTAEKKTRLRAEWTSAGVTEKFFDYVPKGVTRMPSSRERNERR